MPTTYGNRKKNLNATAAYVLAHEGQPLKAIMQGVGLSEGYGCNLLLTLQKEGLIRKLPTISRTYIYGATLEAIANPSLIAERLQKYHVTEEKRKEKRQQFTNANTFGQGGGVRQANTANFVTTYGHLIVCHLNGAEYVYTPKTARILYNLLSTAGRRGLLKHGDISRSPRDTHLGEMATQEEV